MSNGSVVVLGAGGHAKVVVASAQAAGLAVVAVFDDRVEAQYSAVLGVPVDGPLSEAAGAKTDGFVIGIGSNMTRRQIADRYDLPWISVVHPDAYVHASVDIGPGTVVFAGAVIQPDAVIGCHVIVNSGATIDHDCRIGDYAHIAPGANLAGDVMVGSESLIGVGSAVTPGVTIGAGVVVGAQAAVVSDQEPGVTVVGVPARPLES